MPLFDEELEQAARNLRKLLGIEFDPRPDMITVIFKLKDHGLIKGYERVPDSEMPDAEARFDPFNEILYVSESTFVAGHGMFSIETDRRRARYTIAHEAAHIWLKHSRIRYRGQAGDAQEKHVSQIRQEERGGKSLRCCFSSTGLSSGTTI
jgi:hypothetical protein